MVTRRLLPALLTLVALGQAATPSRAETLYIRGARVLPVSGAPIDDAGIVIRDGRIADIAAGLARPPFSREIDATGLTISPGFVLPMTRQATTPPAPPPPGPGFRVEIKPDVKASDEILLRDDALGDLLRFGITSAGVLPPSREPGIPGFASAVALGSADRSSMLAEEAALVVAAASPEPWRKAVREAFEKADRERHGREAAERRGTARKGDPSPLIRCLLRKTPVLLLASTPALLQAAADSMPLERLDVSVLDGTDLWWESERVKALGLRVITYPNLTRQRGTRFPVNRAAEWAHAGVRIAFVLPEDEPRGAAVLRDAVTGLVRTGLSADLALKALTSEPAAALGLAEQVGSIQKGRRADLLFWSGDPFDPTTRLLRVMSGGAFVARPARAELERPARAEIAR